MEADAGKKHVCRGAHNRSIDFHFPSFRGHVKKANFNGGDRQRSSRERRDRKIMQ